MIAIKATSTKEHLKRATVHRLRTVGFAELFQLTEDVLLFIRYSDGRIIESNLAATQVYGYNRTELKQMTIHALRAPMTKPCVEQQMAEAAKDYILFETLHVRRDGTLFPVEVHSRSITVGKELFLLSVIRDISERKEKELELAAYRDRLEEMVAKRTTELETSNMQLQREVAVRQRLEYSLRATMELFANAFQHAAIGMALVDPRGKLIQVNHALCQMLGYEDNELQHRHFSEISHPDDLPKDDILFSNFQSGQSESCKLQKRYLHKNGNTIWGELNVSVIKDTDQNPIYYVGQVQDITDQKKIQAEMARLDRLALVGEMAASISHEIRNPMTTVRGYLQLLRRKSELEQYSSQLDLMIEELDRMNDIISEFLSLAKSKHVKMGHHRLHELVSNILPLIMAESLLQGKEVDTELQPVDKLLLDPKEIRQLLLNLVRNGLDAMKQGQQLTISTYQLAETAVLEVKDEGVGISEENLALLGTPFFTTKETGTGLGLSVCYSIAARHGAEIRVQSSPEGTCFGVYFPLNKA